MTNKEFLDSHLADLDNPEVLINEMNSWVRDWESEEFKDAAKFCFVGLTPYQMYIANLGIAILYDALNARGDIVAERFYYPESKFNKRLLKDGRNFFSKETCHNLNKFDVLGVSSYFPQQMLLLHLYQMLPGMLFSGLQPAHPSS